MTLLVIDVGSSSVRALLIDDDTLQPIEGALARRSVQFSQPQPLAAELDPVWLREQVEACLDEVLKHPRAVEVNRVGMATFVGNLMAVDAHNLPLSPLYTYADGRSNAALDQLRSEQDIYAAHARTGCPHHTAYHPAKLRWLQQTQPQMVAQTAQWLDFATYCYRVWFRRAVPCSYSVASWSGLFNRTLLSWDHAWLKYLSLDVNDLPSLADFNSVQIGLAGDYRQRWYALQRVPFYLAVGDGAAANIGSARKSGEVVLTVGTTAALRVVLQERLPSVPYGLWSYRVDRERHLVGGAVTEGGNVFQWARSALNLNGADIERELAQRPPDAHGLTVLPMFNGERSPNYHPQAVGTLHGLTLNTAPTDILHALLEAVGLRLAQVALKLPAGAVYAGGGALLASPSWCQMIANALNRTLYLSGAEEVTALGVASLITQRESPAAQDIRQTFTPQADAVEVLAAARRRQAKLYKTIYADAPFLD